MSAGTPPQGWQHDAQGDAGRKGVTGGNSRVVFSAQSGIHHDLPRLVRRHRDHVYRRPISAASRVAVEAALARRAGRPLILDSGCGTGQSTVNIALRFADAFVLGIDRSATRLARAPQLPENACLIRADLVDAWRALAARGERVARHYLLYPNPWPKIGQLARRWHGHAVFPDLLALGGVFECRSNWRIYVAELAAAVNLLANRGAVAEQLPAELAVADPLTPFERKYAASGHALHRLVVDLR